MAFVAFLIAAILFFVTAISEPDKVEFIPWGLGFLAVGHMLGGFFPINWPGRRP